MAASEDRGRLWRRLVLVAITGAVPLCLVSLFSVHSSYSPEVHFSQQERRGVAFLGRLDRVFETLSRYTESIAATRAGRAGEASVTDVEREVKAALGALAHDYEGELGQRLDFEAVALADAGREDASLTSVQERWRALEAARGAIVTDAIRKLVGSVRAMIEHTADRSNLILDDNLDSYYLMDVTVVALPQALGRILEVEALLADEPSEGRSAVRDARKAVLVALLRDADLDRVARSAARALREDAAFHGRSASLQARLPPALAAYTASTQQIWQRVDASNVSNTELAAACAGARKAGFELLRVGASELDRLLEVRLDDVVRKRGAAYALIIATLLAAGAVMAWLIRGLLAAHDATSLRAREVLGAKEAQLRALGDNLPGGMMYQVMRELDGSMRFLYVSAGVEVIHGVTAREVLDDPARLYDLVLEEDRPALRVKERESLAQMAPFRAIARSRRHSDGAVRWLEFASAPRRLADGRIVWDGIQMDVTERHLAEVASQQTQKRFSQIFDHSPIPLSLSRFSDSKYVAVNQRFLEFSGFTHDEVIGHDPVELNLYAHPEQRAVLIERLRADGYLHGVELGFRTKSAKVRDSLLWLELLTIDDERYVLGMSLDMTAQNSANQQQRQLEEQLRQAQKLDALGTLAGGIAHDFNNILGAIVVYTELSKVDNPGNAQLLDNLNEILQASERATVLTRQILSFSRRQKEERTALELGPIVKEALSLLRATLPATLAIERDIDAAVPEVMANATQVHQIVMNLCTNAAHAMKGVQGKLRVKLREVTLHEGEVLPHAELVPGPYALLTITDTGHGMDAATLSRIFEPFFTTKRAGDGTGLGLSVVHGIVREYGGAITVQSEIGQGTTFAIYLPASVQRAVQSSPPIVDVPRGCGQRILVVDDEVALGKAEALMLERLGYQPVLFSRSLEALAAFRQAPASYGAVITDLTMPELTGLDLIRELRTIRARLPTILVSGSGGGLSPEELHALGIEEVLPKPLAYRTLALALQRALQD